MGYDNLPVVVGLDRIVDFLPVTVRQVEAIFLQNYFTLMLSGTHMINECFGTLNGIMTVSYEKFILDEEMISRMLRIRWIQQR